MSEIQRTPTVVRERYRRASRRVLTAPTTTSYHRERIRIALNFFETEPLQGALADYFFGCWYDMPFSGQSILEEVKERLPNPIYQAFLKCTQKKEYIWSISSLATRWSILVTPSLDVPTHKLRTSSDTASYVADSVVAALLKARSENSANLNQIEDDFLEHCIACTDRMAFMMVWFRLHKEHWTFHQRWLDCRKYLEQ